MLKVICTSSPDEVVTVSEDGTALVWNLATARPRSVFRGHSGGVNSVALTPDERLALSGGQDRSLCLWSMDSGECRSRLFGHLDVVWRVAASPDCRTAASGSGDNTIRIWDLETNTCLDEVTHPDCVAAVTFDPTGERLVVGCDDTKVYVYRMLPQG